MKKFKMSLLDVDKLTKVTNISTVKYILHKFNYNSDERYIKSVEKHIVSVDRNYPLFLFVNSYNNVKIANKGIMRNLCSLTMNDTMFKNKYKRILEKVKNAKIKGVYKNNTSYKDFYLIISQLFNELQYDRAELVNISFKINVINCLKCPVMKMYYRLKEEDRNMFVMYDNILGNLCPFANKLIHMMETNEYKVIVKYDDEKDNFMIDYKIFNKKYNITSKEIINDLEPKYLIKLITSTSEIYVDEKFDNIVSAYFYLINNIDKIRDKVKNIEAVEVINTYVPNKLDNSIHIGAVRKYYTKNLVKSILIDELKEKYIKDLEDVYEIDNSVLIEEGFKEFNYLSNKTAYGYDYILTMTNFNYFPLPYRFNNVKDLRSFVDIVNQKIYRKFKLKPLSFQIKVFNKLLGRKNLYLGMPFLNLNDIVSYILKKVNNKNIEDVKHFISYFTNEIKEISPINNIVDILENEYESNKV